MRTSMAAPEDKSPSRAQAWFCTTGLPSDVVVEVGDVSFHLHKFPLMSKSKKLLELITEQEETKSKNNPKSNIEEEEENDFDDVEDHRPRHGDKGCEEVNKMDNLRIALPDLPAGVEAFETAAKFCYGVKIELTPSNAVPVRCAASHLQMTDDVSHDNLVARSDRYIAQSICRSVKDSVTALRSCEGLPEAEQLGIARRCVDAIAARAAASSGADPSSLFGWPVDEPSVLAKLQPRRKVGIGRASTGPAVARAVLSSDSWCEELTSLSLPVFRRVISAMKAREVSSDVVEGSLIAYAKRSIPGLSRSGRMGTATTAAIATPPTERERVAVLEAVIGDLPRERTAGATPSSTRLLFGMLRIANILGASEASREALERRIGAQLELAVVDDLLMPSYSYSAETLYHVDCVERLLGYFLDVMGSAASHGEEEEEVAVANTAVTERSPPPVSPLVAVGKLVDRYLSEIASDVNLKPDKFCDLAFALPERARVYDDGLYRAVDVYFKAHPHLSESQREKLCGAMDCQKLTLEACTHAAQNERLPLRAIVQVLFFEQLQLRHAIAGSLLASSRQPVTMQGLRPEAASVDEQVLRLDMDSMRSRVQVLEKECSTMKKAIEKIDRTAVAALGKVSLSRRLGCKFRTQVCDSHERTTVEATKNRAEEQHQSA